MSFDLFRVNVLAVRQNDNVLTSACDRQVAVGIDKTQVAGVEPSVAYDFGGLHVGAIIALHQQRTANPDFANAVFIRRIDPNRHPA